jgi:hypothetical protein
MTEGDHDLWHGGKRRRTTCTRAALDLRSSFAERALYAALAPFEFHPDLGHPKIRMLLVGRGASSLDDVLGVVRSGKARRMCGWVRGSGNPLGDVG